MSSASPSTLIKATKENNAMNKEVEEDFTSMDDNETSEGLLHLCENELSVNGIAQMEVYWAIRGYLHWILLSLGRMSKKLHK